MKRLVIILLLLTAACAAQGHTPQIVNVNGTLQKRSAASGLEAALAAAVKENGASTFWVGYEAATTLSDRMMCCFNSTNEAGQYCCGGCRLDGERGNFINGDVKCAADRPEFNYFFVMARIADGQVAKIRAFSPDCGLDAVNMPVVWLTDVNPKQSIGWLKQQVSRREDKKVDDSALHAIALHTDPLADTVLEEMTAPSNLERLRKQAAFWLGQERGRKGYEIVRKLAFSDQDARFREHLTFVLSQSREKEATDDVIRMAKSDVSERVRGQALFWLAQKAGRKAADTITAAMEQDPNLEVKKKAVFALGQMHDDEGVTRLIQVAQSHPNRLIRKEAIFWLGQSRDPRALDFLVRFVEGRP